MATNKPVQIVPAQETSAYAIIKLLMDSEYQKAHEGRATSMVDVVKESLLPEHFPGKTRIIYERLLDGQRDWNTILRHAEQTDPQFDWRHLRDTIMAYSIPAEQSLGEYVMDLVDPAFRIEMVEQMRRIARMAEDPSNSIYALSVQLGELSTLPDKYLIAAPQTMSMDTIDRTAGNFLEDIDDSGILDYGLVDFDNNVSGGHDEAQIFAIAAEPGGGKTSFMLTAALNAAYNNKRVAIFSLEQTSQQIYFRLLSMVSGIPYGNIANKKLRRKLTAEQKQAITAAREDVGRLPIYVCDAANLDPLTLEMSLNATERRHGKMDLVAIDYLQLMSDGADDDDGGSWKRTLHMLNTLQERIAKGHGTRTGAHRLMILTQLNDKGGIYGGKALHFVAWVIVVLSREIDQFSGAGTEAQAFFKKNRSGKSGIAVKLYFDDERTMFRNAVIETKQLNAGKVTRTNGAGETYVEVPF